MRIPSATLLGPPGWANMILLWSTTSLATSSSTNSTSLLLKTSSNEPFGHDLVLLYRHSFLLFPRSDTYRRHNAT